MISKELRNYAVAGPDASGRWSVWSLDPLIKCASFDDELAAYRARRAIINFNNSPNPNDT